MNFLKRFISILIIFSLASPAYAAKPSTIDTFKGLQRNPMPEYIEDGAFTKFDNLYVKDKHLESVKGRVKLNATANSNTTVNMVCYYENQAGTTKKYVVQENTSLASYDTDGSNRTSLNTSWTNEYHSCKQVGDTLYITSDTDGLYFWTGSGAATAITGPSAPSNVDFSATTGFGGMTPGLDAIVIPKQTVIGSYWKGSTSTGSCIQGFVQVSPFVDGDTCDQVSCTSTSTDPGAHGSGNCFDSTNFTKSCATSTTYSYKVTKWSSTLGIESEPSTADTATLIGNDTVTMAATNSFLGFSDSSCTDGNKHAYTVDVSTQYTGKQTKTTGTLASAPSGPFDGYCIYRTVAGGTDYFKLGCLAGGGTTYTDGKPDTVLGNPLDTTIDTIDPPSYKYVDEYKGSLFLAQGSDIYFTRTGVNNADVSSTDTYWLKTDHLVTGAKEPLTGLKSTSNSLLFFTANKILELSGFGVSSFRFKTLYNGVGSVANDAIETTSDGTIIFFAGTLGVYELKQGQPITDSAIGSVLDNNRAQLEHISSPALDDIFRGVDSQIALTTSNFTSAHAYYDSDRNLYFLFIGSDEFIYDRANKSWSHIPGTKMLASVYRKSPGVAGQGMVIDDLGFFYDNFKGYTNGGPGSGTLTGSPTSSTGSTLTDSGATFYTTGSGLKGVWVIKDNGSTLEYRQISSNTSTALTVVSNWTSNPVTTDTYYIGYVIPDATTKMYSLTKPPGQSVIQSITWVHNKSDSAQTFYNSITYKTEDTVTTISNDSFNLATNFIDKRGLSVSGNWIQLNFRTYISNTSDTINPPLDIINYSIFGDGVEAN